METARNPRSPEPTTAAPRPVDGAATAPAGAPAAPRNRRRPFLILGVVAVVALGGVAAYNYATAGREGTDDAQVSADMVRSARASPARSRA